jgi:hypothetical protein
MLWLCVVNQLEHLAFSKVFQEILTILQAQSNTPFTQNDHLILQFVLVIEMNPYRRVNFIALI